MVPIPIPKTPSQKRDRSVDLLLAGVIEHFALTAVLCDAQGTIQHTAGRVDQFLQFPVGATRLSISDVALPVLRGDLLTLLHRCKQMDRMQVSRRRKLGDAWIRIIVEPLHELGIQLFLVMFSPERMRASDAKVEVDAVLPDGVRLKRG